MMLIRTGWLLALGAVLLLSASVARADQWNERITLSFSSPVMVPGATLPPGTYVFELMNSGGSRHIVRIHDEANQRQIALTQAVAIKRDDVTGDAVLQFNPTDSTAAPAIKAWFYPNSRYGHEFVYSDEQARHIAERTKTVVLSVDVPGSDVDKGTLYNYDASGGRAAWQADEETLREWTAWERSRAAADPKEREEGTATAVRSDFRGKRVTLDDLEENPKRYMGQTISVDGEVEKVLGPRVFTIDEPNWGDLDGEIFVLLPSPLAALVKEDDRVTVSGTLKPFVRVEFEREWGWFGMKPEIEAKVSQKPVLVAERVIGGDNNTALVIDATPQAPRPVGTSGVSGTLTDPSQIGRGGHHMVGHTVALNGVRASGSASTGFFVDAGDRQVFVLPAQSKTTVAKGDPVNLTGVILRMPRGMASRLNGPDDLNEDVYIYATAMR